MRSPKFRFLRSAAALFLSCLCALSFIASSVHAADGEAVHYVASIHPLAAILQEITAGRASVSRLLSPGSSPHTFEPTPSEIKKLTEAKALFFVGPGLDGEWVGRIPANHKVAMIDLVPASFRLAMGPHHHDGEGHANEEKVIVDPHFWTDPLTVKAMLPQLVAELTRLDPSGKEAYDANSKVFAARLDQLHLALSYLLAPVANKPIMLFHPSFNYLFHRYGLELAGVVEEAPGREPTPKFLLNMVNTIKQRRIKALFTEPQLAKRPAMVLAEAAGISVQELDPLGGVPGRVSYADLLHYNASTLAKALQ